MNSKPEWSWTNGSLKTIHTFFHLYCLTSHPHPADHRGHGVDGKKRSQSVFNASKCDPSDPTAFRIETTTITKWRQGCFICKVLPLLETGAMVCGRLRGMTRLKDDIPLLYRPPFKTGSVLPMAMKPSPARIWFAYRILFRRVTRKPPCNKMFDVVKPWAVDK